MTPESILLKLTKRSTPATEAYDVWLAQGYSLADLTSDLMKLAMQSESQTVKPTVYDNSRATG
jgi:hypothetical protein